MNPEPSELRNYNGDDITLEEALDDAMEWDVPRMGGLVIPAEDLPSYVPFVPDIDARILEQVSAFDGGLDMSQWHENVEAGQTCATTHCRAGWAIHLAGRAGYALEGRTTSEIAGTLIYAKSRPGVPTPYFYAADDEAKDSIEHDAAKYSPNYKAAPPTDS